MPRPLLIKVLSIPWFIKPNEVAVDTTRITFKTSVGAATILLATVVVGGGTPSHGVAEEKKHEYRGKDVPITITLDDVTLNVSGRRTGEDGESFNLGQGNRSLPRLLPLKQKAIDLSPSQGKGYVAKATGSAVNTGKKPVAVLFRMLRVGRLHSEDVAGVGFNPSQIDRQYVVINPGKKVRLSASVKGIVQPVGLPEEDGYRQYFRVAVQAYNDDDPVGAGISNVLSTTTGPFVTNPMRLPEGHDGKRTSRRRDSLAEVQRNAEIEAPHGAGSSCLGEVAEDDKQAELKALLKERSELLGKSVKQVAQRYRIGYASYEELARAQREALNAALDSPEGPKARLALLRELKDAAEGTSRVAGAMFEAGVGPEDQMLQARAMLLEIRADILKEEAKSKP